MKRRVWSSWLSGLGLVLFLFCMTGLARPAASSFAPENPKWGDTLTVTYNAAAASAKLRGKRDLYLVYFVDYPDYSERQWTKMKKAGAVFTATIKVAEPVAVYSFHFVSSDDYDSAAFQTAYVSTRAGKPARGANAFKLGNADENYMKYFTEEVTLYPDNYVAYRLKWGIDYDLRKVRKGVLDGLRSEISDFKKKVTQETPSSLYALAFGSLVIDQEPPARAYIKKLAENFAKSPLVERAITDYETQTNSMAVPDEKALSEVQALKLKLAAQYPESSLARNFIHATLGDPAIPLDLVEKIAPLWRKAEPNNPLPLMALGEAYAVRGVQLDKSRELLTQALTLTRGGYLRLYEDTSGHLYKIYLPRLYRTRAEVHLKNKQYVSALSDVNSAIEVGPAQRGHYYEFRGQIREAQQLLDRAEEDYLQAYFGGNSHAREPLRALYRKRNGSEKGFQEYLNKKRTELRKPATQSDKPAVPPRSSAAKPKSP